MNEEKMWPNVGSKVKYKGTHRFWYTDVVKNAEDLLEVGKEYTISAVRLASSWCAIVLEEFPENRFALSFFEYPMELTTTEALSLSRFDRQN